MASQSNAPMLIEHRDDEMLKMALRIAFDDQRASHWFVHEKDGLVFMWHAGESHGIELPFNMDAERAFVFARAWLDEVKFPPEPDHDGDNERGFRVHRDYWGHVGGSHYSIVAVAPCWAMFGK